MVEDDFDYYSDIFLTEAGADSSTLDKWRDLPDTIHYGIAAVIAMIDSPYLPFADIIAGAYLAWAVDDVA